MRTRRSTIEITSVVWKNDHETSDDEESSEEVPETFTQTLSSRSTTRELDYRLIQNTSGQDVRLSMIVWVVISNILEDTRVWRTWQRLTWDCHFTRVASRHSYSYEYWRTDISENTQTLFRLMMTIYALGFLHESEYFVIQISNESFMITVMIKT